MTEKTNSWSKYRINSTEVNKLPSKYEENRYLITPLLKDRQRFDGPISFLVKGPDKEVLENFCRNIAFDIPRNKNKENPIYVDVELEKKVSSESFRDKEYERYKKQKIEKDKKKIAHAVQASKNEPAFLVLKNINELSQGEQPFVYPVLEEFRCGIRYENKRYKANTDNFIVAATMTYNSKGYDLTNKLKSLFQAIIELGEG